ncbi:MAG: ATP-binding protein [Bacteroidia bacterium]
MVSREIRFLKILSWLCIANGVCFASIELFLGNYFNVLVTGLSIILGLGVAFFVWRNQANYAINFFRIGILLLFYIFDSGFEVNTGSYLFYVPFIMIGYLYEGKNLKLTKILSLLGSILSILAVNFFCSPKLASLYISDTVTTEKLFFINLFFSVFSSIVILEYFTRSKKQVSEDLEQNQANYSALVDNTQDQIWAIDTKYRLLSFNHNYRIAFESYWKKSPKLGMNIMEDNSIPVVFDYWKGLYDKALSGIQFKEEQSYDYGGKTNYLEFTFVPVFNNQKVSGVVISGKDISDIRNREEELKTYAQNLNLMLSSTGDIIFELDENGICIRVWHAKEVELVESVNYFIGKSVKELFDDKFKTRLADQFNQVLRTKQSRNYEYSHEFRGELRHYSCKIKFINNYEPIRIAIVLEDITDKKDVEIRQARQSLFLNKLIDHIPLGIYVKSVNDNYAYTLWNRELELLLDLPQSKVIGKTDAEIFSSLAQIKQFNEGDIEVTQTADPLTINNLEINLGFKKITARNFKIPILDASGKVELIIGILENISDIIHVQQELELAEKRWQYALTGSRDVVWDVNIITGEIYYSPLFKEMLGFQESENPVLIWEELIHPDDFKSTWLNYQQHMKGLTPYFEAEYRLKKKDGTYLWILDRGRVAERSENGEALRIIGTFHDITYKKNLEEQLISAKEKAEEASKAKGLFLSTMSHEIRTPMNAVNGIIRLLIQDEPASHQLENLKALKFSSEQLMFLLNDILDFSKIEAGKLEKDERNFRPEELFRNIVQTMSNQVEDKPVKVSLNFDGDIPTFLKGDRHRLGQILSNLLSNAIKFTERGEVIINFRFPVLNDSKYLLYCEVSDTGIGIEEEKLAHIFESFTQASHETSRKFGGTGLGLAISKKLVEWLGGSIGVESKIDVGTRFWFQVPINKGEDNYANIRDKDNEQIHFKPLYNFKILIVEDNKMNVFVIERFLKKWELDFQIATNGKEGINAVLEGQFDLILMDLQMPEMDGFEATKIIRNMGYDIPIFALTANVFSDVKDKVVESGMNDYISKPFNPNELYSKIQAQYNLKFGN